MSQTMVPTVILLGAPQLLLADKPLALPPGKTSALLYYLAYQQDWVGRDDLLYLLWPDAPEKPARRNLRQLLSTIRRLPYAAGLETDEQRLRWPVQTDVQTFKQALKAENRSLATELYCGPLLAGYHSPGLTEFENWLELERQDLAVRWREAVLTLAGELAETNRHRQGADLLARLGKAEPFDEQVLQRQLTLLYLSGQTGKALDTFKGFRRTLQQELGGEPDAATLWLVERIERGESLDGERVGGAHATILTKSLPRRQTNLPLSPTPFVGRQRETAKVSERLSDPQCRLLTLIGPGGIGKTRLALRAAEAQLARFQDGIWFVLLASVDSPEAMVTAVANALGFSFYGSAEPRTQLFEYLQDKQALLVLDNLEHLIAGAELITELLSTAPAVKVLATSRERLNLQAEWLFDLGGLTFPKQVPAADPISCDAVALFLQCARRVQGDFKPQAVDLGALTDICNRVEGMPLALELAAAWLRVLSIAEVAEEVGRGLDALVSTGQDAPERHRSVRAVLETSWHRLSNSGKAALGKLSVFQGGFSREAALAVAGAGLPALLTLSNKSLLRKLEGGRFDLHELVRQFAAEKLAESGQQRQTHHDHAAYFLRFIERQGLWGSDDEAAYQALHQDFENIRAAWLWATANESMLLRPSDLVVYFDRRGRFSEGLELLSSGVASLKEGEPAQQVTLGALLVDEAWLLFRLGRYDDARRSAERGLALTVELEASKTPMKALNILGLIASHTGDYSRARSYGAHALKLAKALGEVSRAAGYLVNIAAYEEKLGNYPQSIHHYEEALALHKQAAQPFGIAATLNDMGYLYHRTGKAEDAYPLLVEALEITKSIEYKALIPSLLINLADTFYQLGVHERAHESAQEALALLDEGDSSFKAAALNTLGRVATALEDFEGAYEHLTESLQLSWMNKDYPYVLESLVFLAELRAKQGKGAQACLLLSPVMHHPAAYRWATEQAQTLMRDLQPHVPDETWRSALEPGGAALEEVIGQVFKGRSDFVG